MANTEIKSGTPAYALQNKVGFTGKYVESLIKSANKSGYDGTTVVEVTKNYKRKLKESQTKQAKKFNLSYKKYVELNAKAYNLLSFFSTGHSMGCYRSLEIKVGKEFKTLTTNNNLDRYANSCKWRPTYGNITIKLTAKELDALQNIEGIWTIVNSDGSAKWLKSAGNKNTYEVVWGNGFVVGVSHSTISLSDAENLERIKRQAIVNAEQNDRKFIGISHVQKTGACMTGIEAFCNRHGLDCSMGYNLAFLKSLNDKIAERYFAKV